MSEKRKVIHVTPDPIDERIGRLETRMQKLEDSIGFFIDPEVERASRQGLADTLGALERLERVGEQFEKLDEMMAALERMERVGEQYQKLGESLLSFRDQIVGLEDQLKTGERDG